MRKFFVLASLIFLFLSLSCSSKQQLGESTFVIEVSSPLEDSLLYVWTYGANAVSVDTILIKEKKQRISWSYDRDTLDLFCVYGQDGRLIAPMFPKDRKGMLIRINDEETPVEGVREVDIIRAWCLSSYECSADSMVPEIRDLLRQNYSPLLSMAFAQELKRRFPDATYVQFLDSIMSVSSYLAGDWHKITGKKYLSQPLVQGRYFPLTLTHKEEPLVWKKIYGNSRYILLQILPPLLDSIERADQNRLFYLMDSLQCPTYTVLPEEYTVPKEWGANSKRSRALPARYFLTDTMGGASLLVSGISPQDLPYYIILDSIRRVTRLYMHRDSVVTFIETYRQEQKIKK